MKILVTGTAGFIGFHAAKRLLGDGHEVVGVDSMVPYYDVRLKERRHAILGEEPGFTPHVFDLRDMAKVGALIEGEAPDIVVHLAAQAGVRYALEHPEAYIDSNVIGSFNLLEACRRHPVRHFLMASTSSAYGANTKLPLARRCSCSNSSPRSSAASGGRRSATTSACSRATCRPPAPTRACCTT